MECGKAKVVAVGKVFEGWEKCGKVSVFPKAVKSPFENCFHATGKMENQGENLFG
jgi:hypothetical protein